MKFYISTLALCAALAASVAYAQEINLGDALVNDIGDALVITNTAKPAPAATTAPAADAAVNSSPEQMEEEPAAASPTQGQSFNSVPAAPEKEAIVTPVQNTANSAVSNDPVSVNGGNAVGKEDTSPSTQVANNDAVKESTGNDIAKDTANDTAANSADSNSSQQNNAAVNTAADTAADENNITQALSDLADGATTDDTGVDVSVHMVVASDEESGLGSDDDADLELDSEESNANGEDSDDDLSKHSGDEEETDTSAASTNTLASGFSLSAAFAAVAISSALF